MKNQISDLSTALKSNKDLLIEMSDKFNAQLAINHKNLERKTEQIKQISQEKDEIIEKLRENFSMHMNALIFTCEKCGSSKFKTEVWKEGLDKTRFTSKEANSEQVQSAIYGSNTLKNHFESFCQWIGSSQKQKPSEVDKECNDEELDKSLRTFRLVDSATPNKNVPKSCLDHYADGDGSVIIRDVSPMQLRFTSENNEESEVMTTPLDTSGNDMPFNPNELYCKSSPSKDLDKASLKVRSLSSDQKEVNVSNMEEYKFC